MTGTEGLLHLQNNGIFLTGRLHRERGHFTLSRHCDGCISRGRRGCHCAQACQRKRKLPETRRKTAGEVDLKILMGWPGETLVQPVAPQCANLPSFGRVAS